jgi:hypothetical protein
MSTENTLIAHRSVVELHQWIEAVFRGAPDSVAVRERLMGSFHRDFIMVTTGGQTVGLAEVEALFQRLAGARPALSIEIDACETLVQEKSQVVCRYRKTHHDGDSVQARWSVAMIEVIDQQPYWRFLQETAIPA